MKFRTSLAMTAILSTALGASAQEPAHSTRAEWMYKAKFGVFTHYMADTVNQGQPLSVDAWNAAVDSFDVNAMADRLAAVGAGYYVITLGQNSGYYCSPNKVYDDIVGITPSHCSRRDLVADLYDALSRKGIRLMVYLPSGAPDRDPEAMKKLEWENGGKTRMVSFQRKWESVIAEWSRRWGTKVCGWWFDGCYFADAMYRFPDEPNYQSFANAARAGNPDSVVAFNPGVATPIITVTPAEDYTAGEINEPAEVKCFGRWVGQAQYQMLSYLGKSWAGEPPRFTTGQAVGITTGLLEKDGVVTWDVPVRANGDIPIAFIDQLKAIGDAAKAIKR